MDGISAITPVSGSWVWTPQELAARDDWIVQFGKADFGEIDAAIRTSLATGKPATETAKQDFPLPTLASRLETAAASIRNGAGIALIRGLPVERYDRPALEALLWGIGSHLGVAESQSFRGDMIGDVMDMSHTGDTRRSYRSPRPLAMHVDPVDIVGLLCLRIARHGGESVISSAMNVHNTILAERPDLLPWLYRGYHYGHSEADSSGEAALSGYRVPVFKKVGDRLAVNFNAPPIRRAYAAHGIEDEPEAIEAFEYFIEVSGRTDIRHEMSFAPGDLQFLNNRVILHGRREFEDWPELDRKRLLLRLWLTPPGWPEWPEDMYWRPAGSVHGRGHRPMQNRLEGEHS